MDWLAPVTSPGRRKRGTSTVALTLAHHGVTRASQGRCDAVGNRLQVHRSCVKNSYSRAMAYTLRTQVVFQAASHNPADVVTATFHFHCAEAVPPEQAGEDAAGQVISFYNAPGPGSPLGRSIGQYMSGDVSRGAADVAIKSYDLRDDIPRLPRSSTTRTLAAPVSAQALPRQVCVAVSFAGLLAGLPEGQPGVAGQPRPRARHRGRLFIGPLVVPASDAGAPARPASTFMDTVSAAAQALRDGLWTALPVGQVQWAVYSKVTTLSYSILSGWIDNRFDTQRRRAVASTLRSPW